jgi:hypothetical protein
MKIGTAFPSKYLKCADLNGREVACTISRVVVENVGGQGDEEDKPVLYLTGKTKGVVLNRTNAMTIAAKYGDDTDEWTTKPIVIYPDQTMYQGRMVDCIRMRVPAAVAVDPEEVPF